MGRWVLFIGFEEKIQKLIDTFPLGTFEVEEVSPSFQGVQTFGSSYKVKSLIHYKDEGGYIRIIPIGSMSTNKKFDVIHCPNWVDWRNAPSVEMEDYQIERFMSEVLTNSSNTVRY